MDHPPKCSRDWTLEERAALAAWIAKLFLKRIDRDNPAMPVVAKAPTYELMRTIHFVLTQSAELLEASRAALEKPYDRTQDRHDIFAGGDLSSLTKSLN